MTNQIGERSLDAATKPRNVGRSTIAILAGFIAVVVLSVGTDEVLHLLQVYPPWGQPMVDPKLVLLALAYRTLFTIAGGYIAARLAPRNPMFHAVLLGLIGLVPGAAGVVVNILNPHLGLLWYPVALALLGLPSTWLGGILHRTWHPERS